MSQYTRLFMTLMITLVAFTFSPMMARAGIMGFDSLTGWTYNQGDSGSPPVIVNSDSIQFTTGPNNRRSLWFGSPQDITQFFVSYKFRASSISASALRQGITFAVQADPLGTGALGSGDSGFGYSGIAPSAAVTLETDTGPGQTYSGFYSNGILGGGSASTAPVNAFNFRDIDVSIAYSGSILSVTMVDGADVFGPQDYFVGSLASTLGSSTAYVGFTGSTFNTLGAGGGANFFLSDFQFLVPEPATLTMLVLAGAVVLRRRPRRSRRRNRFA